MASPAGAFLAGGLLTGIGAAAVTAAENSGKEERENRRIEIEHKNRLEEMQKGGEIAGANSAASDTRHAASQIENTTLTGAQARDRAREEIAARASETDKKIKSEEPLRGAQTNQANAGAAYSNARATDLGTRVTVDARTGQKIDPDTTDVPAEHQLEMSRASADRYSQRVMQDKGSRERAQIAADAKRDVAKDRKFAPDEITKIRAARDALPDDHPDRPIYDAHLREIAAGKGTLTAAKQSEIRLRVSKDVQTATDARGKNLYPTPEAQDAEVERRISKIMPGAPTPAAPAAARPAPAPAPPKPAPAAKPMPMPKAAADAVDGQSYTMGNGAVMVWNAATQRFVAP